MNLEPTNRNTPLSGQVDAAGELEIKFGPPTNQVWQVEQVTIEMASAPVGATVDLRFQSALIARAGSPRRATAGGDPPIFLQGGETMSVVWENATPGDVGNVFIVYRQGSYY